jgi:hypothetical protein
MDITLANEPITHSFQLSDNKGRIDAKQDAYFAASNDTIWYKSHKSFARDKEESFDAISFFEADAVRVSEFPVELSLGELSGRGFQGVFFW